MFFFFNFVFVLKQIPKPPRLCVNNVTDITRKQKRSTVNKYIHRVLSFFSSRRNWNSPTSIAAGECAPLPLVLGGGAHSLAGEGLGEPQSDEGTYTVVLCKYKYFVDIFIFSLWENWECFYSTCTLLIKMFQY